VFAEEDGDDGVIFLIEIFTRRNMNAGCWLGDAEGRASILQDGTTHVERVAKHLLGCCRSTNA
jgi:hypothetical protein